MKNLKNDTKNSIKLRVKNYKKYSLLSYFLSIQLCKNTERNKKQNKTIIFSYLLFRASCKYLKNKHYFMPFQCFPFCPTAPWKIISNNTDTHIQPQQHADESTSLILNLWENGKKLRKKVIKNISKTYLKITTTLYARERRETLSGKPSRRVKKNKNRKQV